MKARSIIKLNRKYYKEEPKQLRKYQLGGELLKRKASLEIKTKFLKKIES